MINALALFFIMKQKFSYRRLLISDCSEKNLDFQMLFSIFRATLRPEMHFREFRTYFFSEKLNFIDVTFVMLDQKIIGFCSAAFYKAIIDGREHTIGRAATGILENFRGNALPKWKLYKKYINYWIRHPLHKILISAYVANPLIYSMICKYTGIAYPKPFSKPPAKVLHIKDVLLKTQNLQAKENPPFVVEIHFCVAISDKEQERIFKSEDGAVKYFLQINPKFRERYGVLVIIPVNLKNISYSSVKFLYYYIKKSSQELYS
jgi:hypothetical protein